MARSRNLKPGFFKNEFLSLLDPYARLLFAGLWTLADREGRLEDRPLKIKAELFPYESVDAEKLLDELDKSPDKFIIRYVIDNKHYIQISNWLEHQNPHRQERPSKIPAYDTCRENNGTCRENNGSDRASSLIPSSLIPDSLNLIPDCGFPLTNNLSTTDEFSIIPETVKSRLRKWIHGSNVVWVGIAQWVSRGTPEEWILTAIDNAERKNACNWAYLEAALKGIEAEGGPGIKPAKEEKRWYEDFNLTTPDGECDICGALDRTVRDDDKWLCKKCWEEMGRVEALGGGK